MKIGDRVMIDPGKNLEGGMATIVGIMGGTPIFYFDEPKNYAHAGDMFLSCNLDPKLDLKSRRFGALNCPEWVKPTPLPKINAYVGRCITCCEIATHASPNLPGDKFQCYSCRQSYRCAR